MRRVAAIQRKVRAALGTLHPDLRVSIPKPLFSPLEPIVGIIRVAGQDIGAVRADAKDAPHSLKFEPSAVQRYELNVEAIQEKELTLLASASRNPDTSEWLG